MVKTADLAQLCTVKLQVQQSLSKIKVKLIGYVVINTRLLFVLGFNWTYIPVCVSVKLGNNYYHVIN